MAHALSAEQKRSLLRDGYVHIKQCIPKELTSAARAAIEEAERDPQVSDGSVRPTGSKMMDAVRQIGTKHVATDIVNRSPLASILTDLMGKFEEPQACQIAYTPVNTKAVEELKGFGVSGYENKDMPYHGAWLHHDGLCGIVPAVTEPVRGTKEEVYEFLMEHATLNGADTGRSAETIGSNVVPLFMDPEMTLGVGSFTAFVITALHDQRLEGSGQTGKNVSIAVGDDSCVTHELSQRHTLRCPLQASSRALTTSL